MRRCGILLRYELSSLKESEFVIRWLIGMMLLLLELLLQLPMLLLLLLRREWRLPLEWGLVLLAVLRRMRVPASAGAGAWPLAGHGGGDCAERQGQQHSTTAFIRITHRAGG